ncbi:LysR substrate-binding domain-containing protein [Paenibacillus pasadenensis]|uniref:LysR family transcriptional regulator n=1 Tax=Paenibacillus TaxID=44249 RepID=UPI000423A59E|nr:MULTISPECIES: LysR substrate-binding domain-containing protein [Paenibacillus]QGG57920.1 LysR family transcriptional regulator [Paenibacillus sp. B01]
MNLHALRLFRHVADTGSVTRASERMRISQPAITSQIRKLEGELGVRLLEPDGRGIRLTDAGRQVDELARRLFAVEQQIERLAHGYAEGSLGQIRLAATYLPANYLLPAWLARFRQRYDDVELSVRTTNSSEAMRLLLAVEVDLALYGGLPEVHPADIRSEELFRDELWFVVSPDHRYAGRTVPLERMVAEPFVQREPGSSTRERLLALCRTHSVPEPTISLQFNGLHESIRAVAAGYGASFVSSLVVRDAVRRGELSRVEVEGVRLHNSIALCTRRGEPLPPAAAALAELIRGSGIQGEGGEALPN